MKARFRTGRTVGQIANGIALLALLAHFALAQDPDDDAATRDVDDDVLAQDGEIDETEPVTVTVHVEGIKRINNSFILVLLAPADGESGILKEFTEIEFDGCAEEENLCGVAGIRFRDVDAGEYKMTVCHTRNLQSNCPTGDDGELIEAGEIRAEIDVSTDERYLFNLGGSY